MCDYIQSNFGLLGAALCFQTTRGTVVSTAKLEGLVTAACQALINVVLFVLSRMYSLL